MPNGGSSQNDPARAGDPGARPRETVLHRSPPWATGLLPGEERAPTGTADHQRPASLIGNRNVGAGEPAWASAPGAHDPSPARGLRFDAIGRRGGKAKRNATGRDGGPRFRD